MINSRWLIGVLGGILLVLGGRFVAPGETLAPAPVSCAFVDLEKALQEHPQRKKLEETFNQEGTARIEQLKQQMQKVRKGEEDLDIFVPNSPEWIAKKQKIEREKAEIEVDRKMIHAELQVNLVKAMKRLYEEAQAKVEEIRKERSYAYVCMYSSSPIKGNTRNELITDMVTRPFVCHDPALDITEELITRLKR